MPSYDTWCNETYVKEWGEKNNTKVVVDNVGTGDILNHAAEESKAQQGHDLFAYYGRIPTYEDEVINHRDIAPCFPHTVPDMQTLLSHDAKATPPDKYKVLSDAGTWTTNIGYPGYTNAAIAEILNSGVSAS